MEDRIQIPEGVTVAIEGRKVTVKGKKGSLHRDFSDPRYDTAISMTKADKEVILKTDRKERKIRSVAGTFAAHVRNMIFGVTKSYKYKLKIHYTHFPITLEVKGTNAIVKNFLGEKSLRKASVAKDVKVEIKKDEVTVTGIDKESVSQSAANIEKACRLSRKDRRVFLDGIYMAGWEFAE